MTDHRIAVIPGDGIGREVMPEGVRVMETAAARHGIRFRWQEFDWSCDWYKAHGRMCPDDAPQTLRAFDAVYFGADRKSTRLNSSHIQKSRMPSSA